MRISELSPSPSPSPLPQLESLTHQLESLSPSSPSFPSSLSSLAASLRSALPLLSPPPPVPNLPLLLWKLSFRLWNASVDLSNHPSLPPDSLPHLALLRHSASDLLLVAGPPAAVPSPHLKSASFFLKTALLWLHLRRPELASTCLDAAASLLPSPSDAAARDLLLGVSVARSRAAWDLSDRALAVSILNRAKGLASGSPGGCRSLAEQYLRIARAELSDGGGTVPAARLLEDAVDLAEKGARAALGREEAGELEALRGRCLRFVAAERSGAGDHEGVLRCVKVLREGCRVGEEHPSVGFVAMRAWLGVGRLGEAEAELRGLLGRKGAGEGVCVRAAEEFVEAGGDAVGAAVAVAARFGAMAAARVAGKVAGKGNGRLVADVVCDERVVGVFAGGEYRKERGNMHAIVWNCGAEHFRIKDYQMAAELFEKSMLYLARDEDNKSRRANCYRLLCLCYLGLSQLNRAEEFINEAEKLEFNINCAFLKLKVYLQKKAEKEGISQVEAMVNCIDFKPEYLTLSIHEAIACQSFPVAIASLSILLNLYSPGKVMPMQEVVVLRNIIVLLLKSSDSELQILKYTKRARNRMHEVGTESFFGSGAVGEHELKWFAAQSWNLGLKTGREKSYEYCVEFLELASEYYLAIPERKSEYNAMACKAQILSAAAIIASEEHTKISLPDASVKKAMEMLDKAGKILSSASYSATSTNCNDNSPFIETDIIFLHTLNTYQLLNKQSEDPGSKQLQLIKSFLSSSKAVTPQNLLHLGLIASQGSKFNPEVASFILTSCLNELLASPFPDYETLSLVIRKLVGVSTSRTEKFTNECDPTYDVYQQAYRIIVGLEKGQYPSEEGKWLATTAWNRSGLAIRLGQAETALKWMKMGMDIARHISGMDSYMAGMENGISLRESANIVDGAK